MAREAHVGADDERKVVGRILVCIRVVAVVRVINIILVGKGLAVAPIWGHLAIL